MAGFQSHFRIRNSLLGRKLGFSSTGGIVTLSPGTTDVSCAAQMWGPGMCETITAAGGTLSNYGISIISSGSTAGSTYYIADPELGLQKQIVIVTSATSMTLNTGGALFRYSSAHFASTLGSTILTYLSASATQSLGVIDMLGLSTAAWLILKKPTWVTT